MTAKEVLKQLAEALELRLAGSVWMKYVRMQSGEFRFIDFRRTHSELVPKEERPELASAGQIVVYRTRWRYESYDSMILRCGWDRDDTKLLEGLLGLPYDDTSPLDWI